MTQAGESPQTRPMITREVRWFFEGPLPADVRTWFKDGARRGVRECRTDVYDRRVAESGVGIKRRDGAEIDAKHMVGDPEIVEFLPGVTGRVEDWEKTGESGLDVGRDQVVVSKEILTLTFDHPESSADEPIGCEAELASIRVGSHRAWSLCFETYGDPGSRAEALQIGIGRLLGKGQLPAALSLSVSHSFGYPQWITRLESTG